ncbi:MAG: hypothetical protein UX16_C0012G0012 [Parcubacteria group bacterium GW2011_GWB1_45_7]|uniref:Uncharacterized protein n=2 Tax=Candidatus Colwelliibacteriota TaxID=1817904 RepID=A0A1G1ZB33_9BACT|nr:MAG: hypothetical protein UX16_C0012G0012 [Parcubacteria group bacterium GW2011_GWB1_45_7]OGY61639.1 MAG: hypothetical protein A3I33_00935 [Candidatus Colwellbacteria bacterium RIFCSPLOWO2_02_FULL_45_11]OGY61863.1 MAG: hypothetical protein A3G58_01190 [Candidatus Colwellbacteria bacterium RIFCSPLOWO2_12_FULL_46_17]
MADIKVSPVSDDNDEYIYDVEVTEGGSATEHRVTLAFDYYETITNGEIDPDELVKKSFEFLLDKEPKEAILGEFNIEEILQHFPDFEDEVLSTE